MVKEIRVVIQNGELGQRGGINTYSMRLCKYLNEMKKDLNNKPVDVKASMFISKPVDEDGEEIDYDIMSLQYEPAICTPDLIRKLMNKEDFKPMAITVHHTRQLESLYNVIEGFIFHSKDQSEKMPYDYKVIPHPALVYPELSKDEIIKRKKKIGLPLDKKILGTAGFIWGSGKMLPITAKEILKNLNDDEFLFLCTSMWKGGDNGHKKEIYNIAKKLGKEKQILIYTKFLDDKSLNANLQLCDMLYAWCGVGPNEKGSQSGIAADMYGSRRKLIVKECGHYSFIGGQDKVLVGRPDPKEFAEDVLKAFRNEDLKDVQKPEWLSWQEQIKHYFDYFKEIIEED